MTHNALVLAIVTLMLVSNGAALSGSEPPEVGAFPPPLIMEDVIQGPSIEDISWEQLRGNVIILEFWSTWCPPCVASIPHLNDIARNFADEAVQVIAISNEDVDTVRHYVQEHEMDAWVLVDKENASFDAFHVNAIPKVIVVDSNGTIAAITHPQFLTNEVITNVLELRDAGLPVEHAIPSERGDVRFEAFVKKGLSPGYAVGGNWRGEGHFGAATRDAFDLAKVLAWAYDVPTSRIKGADKLGGRFTISVRAQDRSNEDVLEMLRQTLEMSFDFHTDRVVLDVDAYELHVTTAVSEKLESSIDESNPGELTVGFGTVEATAVSLDHLAQSLEWMLQMPVVDETEMNDRFNYVLKLSPDVRYLPADERRSRLIEAVHQQLGLELRPATRRLEVLKIVTNVEPHSDTK